MKILVAGDYCPQKRVAERIEQHDFETVLEKAKSIIEKADYAIVNFECSVSDGTEVRIAKQGSSLRCSAKGVEAVRWAGFHCVTLANNHFRDYGDKGVWNTLQTCNSFGINVVGGGMSIMEASKTLYKKFGNKTLAIVNCCEHECSIATDTHGGSNPLNPIQQFYAIKEAKKKAEYVLVIVHGGHEHWQLPSPRMVETYRFFIDAGADSVVNHHQHCFSGYEVYKGKPIFYGLGNFCFDNPGYNKGVWDCGYMVDINFNDTIKFELIPYEQCKTEPSVIPLNDRTAFDNRIRELNNIISDGERLENETTRFFLKSTKATRLILEPYSGRILCKLYLMGLLPSLYGKRKLIGLSNKIGCEAHRDKTIKILESLIGKN